MATQPYDIIFAGDFREPSFRTTATVDQLQAAAAGGYHIGITQLSGDSTGRQARIHQDIRKLIEADQVALLDPDLRFSTKLLIVIDPQYFAYRPRRILTIDAKSRVILVSHGPIAANGQSLYDWPETYKHAHDVLGGEVSWAPINPSVRQQLQHLDPRPQLTKADWFPCIDPEEWRLPRLEFCSPRPVIGRSGQHVEKAWPNTACEILARYPDDPRFQVRLLNGSPILQHLPMPYPRNWEVLRSEDIGERDFLASIDFFVYSHHPDQITPIDSCLLRAMASGAVAILPPSFEPIFGDAAVYAEPDHLISAVQDLYASRERYLAVSEAGKQLVDSHFSKQAFIDHLRDLIGLPDRGPESRLGSDSEGSLQMPSNRRRVMFITINGIGMGHLTRMLAIAKRCPGPIEPVFVTMSQALKVLRQQGYLAEFIPSRQYLDCDINRWNSFLQDEINEMISFYDPTVVIFDGNVPYQGLIEAIKDNPDTWYVWSRRGMWRSDNTDIVGREKYFDVVLEPGDLAAFDDHGITTRHRKRTHHVKPIRLLDSGDMLSRDDARIELGMDRERSAVLIQLGAGNNFDYRSVHNTALEHITARSDAQIAVGEWLISDQPIDLPEKIIRMPGYPFARYFKAFDLAISAVGYNSFHELLFAGVPTIFVPNEAMAQDNQLARALFADRRGLAACVRTKDVYHLTATIDKLLQQDERDRIRSKLSELDPINGAAEAALLIEEMTLSRRVDRP
ncbi:MAG: glycosyltransferase [Geminicoccaceae bacterium]